MLRSLLFTLAWVAMGGGHARAATPAHDHGSAPAERAARSELGAHARFDTEGALWAVHKVSGHIAVSRSRDFGRSWQNPVLVTPQPEPTDAGGDARPKIALGPAGEIYVTWTRPLARPYTGEIRLSRSLDGGRTFSPSVVVHRDRQEIAHRFDALAVNFRGQVFVGWIDKRDLVAAGGNEKAYRGAAAYYAVSDDRAATFRGDFKIADHACECCRIVLVARPDGAVEAMWRHIFPPNIRDHAIATLFADGRAGALRRASFEDWRIDACPHHGPSLALDAAARLHAVWFSAAPTARGVFYGRLRGEGVDGLRRVGSTGAGHADVATNDTQVAVAWKSYTDGHSRLHGMRSDDGGNTWRELELASVPGSADHPVVLAHGGKFFVFWNAAENPLAVVPWP